MASENESDARWVLFYDPHSRKKGIETRKLVEKLGSALGVKAHPRHPTPRLGEHNLSWVDIAILDKETLKVKVLCEIEESDAQPKKILGDIVNVLLSKTISIKISESKKAEPYGYCKPHLLLGLPKVDERAKKIEREIRDRVNMGEWSFEVIQMNELVTKVKDFLKVE